MSELKRCSKCASHLPLENFSRNSSTRDGLTKNCKHCHSLYVRSHYTNNRSYYVEKARRRAKELRQFVVESKTKPCTDCGIQYPPWVMDFDHLEGTTKVDIISDLLHKSSSKTKLVKEIAKCEVVCANCHRQRTHERSVREAQQEERPATNREDLGSTPSTDDFTDE